MSLLIRNYTISYLNRFVKSINNFILNGILVLPEDNIVFVIMGAVFISYI